MMMRMRWSAWIGDELGLEGHGVHLQIWGIKGIMEIEGIKITYDFKLNKSTSTE